MDSLASTSPASGHFPLSDQYAKSFRFKVAAKPADSGEADKVTDPQMPSAPRGGFKFNMSKKVEDSKPGKRKATVIKPASKPKPGDHIYGSYIPHNFLERAKLFREEEKRDGCTPAEARKLWVQSTQRAEMPLSELKRRRFVGKGMPN